MEKGRGIAVYSRKSRFTGKGESVGNQVELCRAYVGNLYGHEAVQLCEIFEDEGFSGGDLNRPAFRNMMDGVRKGRFRAVVVYRLDRISRNISDFAGLIDELTRLDVAFISIREQFDTSTPMGRAMMFIISVFSQLERETIAERIRDNMHELAKTGRWLGGNPPLGYVSAEETRMTLDGKARKSCKLVPVPEELEIPRRIFQLYDRLNSLTAVEAELLRCRIRTRQGKEFTRFAIKGILENPVYMMADGDAYDYFVARGAEICMPRECFDGSGGVMAYNRTDQQKGHASIKLPVDRWIIAVGKHPGVIPSRMWIRMQESLERNKKGAYRKPRRNVALATGLLRCSCGDRMYPKLYGQSYSYVCRLKERSKGSCCAQANVSGARLDEMVLNALGNLEEDSKVLVQELQRAKLGTESGEGHRQMGALRLELEKNEQILKGLVDAMAVAPDSEVRGRILGRMEELHQANELIEQRMEELSVVRKFCILSEEDKVHLIESLASFGNCLIGMPVEEKRMALRELVKEISWNTPEVWMRLR